MNFLFLDRQVAVAVKPAGIPTQESEGFSTNFTLQVMDAIAKKEEREKVYLHAAHRLDTPASGIVLFARTSKALSRIQEALRNKQFHKEYLIEIEGHLDNSSGRLENHLLHTSHRSEIVSPKTRDSQIATLTYKIEKEKQKTTVVRVFLETGRYHQIRCQFAHLGHPIVGDAKYGSQFPGDKINLHHTKLTFTHPVSKELITLESLPTFLN